MKNNGKNTFDWEGFQNQFFGEGHWQEGIHNPAGYMPWVDQYVRDLIAKTVPNPQSASTLATTPQVKSFTATVYETHHFVLARIKLLSPADPHCIRFLLSHRELILEGLPNEEQYRINLPCNVRLNGSKVIYKDHVFEVRMPKEEGTLYHEIPVKYV